MKTRFALPAVAFAEILASSCFPEQAAETAAGMRSGVRTDTAKACPVRHKRTATKRHKITRSKRFRRTARHTVKPTPAKSRTSTPFQYQSRAGRGMWPVSFGRHGVLRSGAIIFPARCVSASTSGGWTEKPSLLIYRAMRGLSGPLPFIKMHGLGNDFVILDARRHALTLDATAAQTIADRHAGIGCDQILVIEPARNARAAAFMRIRNADGSEAEACGNGARCVADLLLRETARQQIVLETRAGLIEARGAGDHRVAVDMGEPRLEWRDIPLAHECDTLHVPLALGPLSDPVCTSMGNPHATFFVRDAEAVNVAALGPKLEHNSIFPERANIGVAQVQSRERLRLRVWERADGLTLACGSGACAALVAARRRGLTERHAQVISDGGPLEIEWRSDNHVVMTGPVAISFSGTLDPSLVG